MIITPKKQAFEDVSPITNGDFPVSHISELRGSKMLAAKVTPERRTALAVTMKVEQVKFWPKRFFMLHFFCFARFLSSPLEAYLFHVPRFAAFMCIKPAETSLHFVP